MSLHDPIRFSLITRALIDVQRHEGTMLLMMFWLFLTFLLQAGYLNVVGPQIGNGSKGVVVSLCHLCLRRYTECKQDADPILGEFFVKYATIRTRRRF